jgi:hypothetical protein
MALVRSATADHATWLQANCRVLLGPMTCSLPPGIQALHLAQRAATCLGTALGQQGCL